MIRITAYRSRRQNGALQCAERRAFVSCYYLSFGLCLFKEQETVAEVLSVEFGNIHPHAALLYLVEQIPLGGICVL